MRRRSEQYFESYVELITFLFMWRLWILCVFFLVLLVLWVWCVCVGASFCSFVVSESLLHYHDEAVMVAATLLIQKTTRGVSFRSPTRTKIDMFCLRHFSRFSCHALFARDSDCFLASQNMLENDLTFEFYDGHACQTKNNHASTPTQRASQPVSQPTSQPASPWAQSPRQQFSKVANQPTSEPAGPFNPPFHFWEETQKFSKKQPFCENMVPRNWVMSKIETSHMTKLRKVHIFLYFLLASY